MIGARPVCSLGISSGNNRQSDASNCIAWTKDGGFALTGTEAREIHLWNPHRADIEGRGSLVKTYRGGHSYGVYDLCVAPGNERFISVGGDKNIFMWDVMRDDCVRRIPQAHSQRINCVDMNTEGCVLLTGSDDSTAKLWDLRSNSRTPLQILNEFQDSVTSVHIIDNQKLLGTSLDGIVYTYDVRMGRLLIDTFIDPITCSALSSDDKCILLSCHRDTTTTTTSSSSTSTNTNTNNTNNDTGDIIYCVEYETGIVLQSYTMNTKSNYKIPICFSYDDAYIYAGSQHGHIYCWELVSGNKINDIKLHSDVIMSVANSPKFNRNISTGIDGTVICWDWDM
jgi:mitogen-activated protein kinase organizer 1